MSLFTKCPMVNWMYKELFLFKTFETGRLTFSNEGLQVLLATSSMFFYKVLWAHKMD